MMDKFWALIIYLIHCGFLLLLFLGLVYGLLLLSSQIVGIFI